MAVLHSFPMGYANRGPQGCPSPQAVDTVLSRRTDAQTKVYHSRGNQLKTNVVPFVAALFAILLLAAVPASAQTDLVTCGPTSYPKFCHSFQISPGFILISGWASASSPQESSGGISVMCSNFSAAIYVPCNPATQTVSFSTGPVSQSITYDMVIYMSSCTYLYSGDAGTVILSVGSTVQQTFTVNGCEVLPPNPSGNWSFTLSPGQSATVA